ncbi:MAG: SoxR reducing system RseC family protein, partial [Clostridia bacterium]|nr:SoxR reducing system RseC family protein [Clostridia bacterium]
SVLAYGLPLVFMIAGMFLGSLVSDNELIQALSALFFGGVGALYLLLSEKKRRKTQRFKCVVSSSSGDQRKLS